MTRCRGFIDTDVLTAARERIEHILDTFDTLVVMFSGGKDSLATLHLVHEALAARGVDRVNVVFRDEEFIPETVIDFVNKYRQLPWVDMRWYAVPLQSTKYILGRSTEYAQWDPNREHARPIPPWAITLPPEDPRVFDQYTMDALVAEAYPGKLAFLTGIRAAESLVRMRACMNKLNESYINAVPTTTRVKLCKPIYDWQEDDVFRYFFENGIEYCPVYDNEMWSGSQLRVSTPTHAENAKNLRKIAVHSPDVYAAVMRAFPEMAVQARYYHDIDHTADRATYGTSYAGVHGWIAANITDPKQLQLAEKRYKSVMHRAATMPASYPPNYLLTAFMTGAYKREIMPQTPRRKNAKVRAAR